MIQEQSTAGLKIPFAACTAAILKKVVFYLAAYIDSNIYLPIFISREIPDFDKKSDCVALQLSLFFEAPFFWQKVQPFTHSKLI